jgi:short subunit dehydrogenase-like uncharacterized protein
MSLKTEVVIYGSYGYTGSLIVQECLSRNVKVRLSGRDEVKLKKQSKETGLSYQVTSVDDERALISLLENAIVVIHCAGPFKHTARIMAEACIKTKTHYTDITGEFEVFEMLNTLDNQAKQNGITLMPGVGFDVVPSDCLAAHLKRRLPSATHLQLAFTSLKGGLSRGTARTSIEGLGQGSYIRENGKLKKIPMGSKSAQINFGEFSTSAVCIPWGDIATAYHSTHIPNIGVYMGMPEKNIRLLRLSNAFNWFLNKPFVKNFLKKQIDKRVSGPSDERRSKGRSFLCGKVSNEKGDTCISTLQTYDGYTLTAKTCVLILQKIISNNFKAGYQTPSMAYGPDLILEVDTTKRNDL